MKHKILTSLLMAGSLASGLASNAQAINDQYTIEAVKDSVVTENRQEGFSYTGAVLTVGGVMAAIFLYDLYTNRINYNNSKLDDGGNNE